MIEERKIGEWSNPIVNEADRPNRSAADMKAIFDSNANELKDALNGLIDDLGNGAMQVAFTEAGERENISAADTLATIMGKLAKFFTDAQTALNVVKIDAAHPNRFLSADGTYSVPEAGEAVNGLPAGGTPGQHLVKNDDGDYDAEWRDLAPADIGAVSTAEKGANNGVATLDGNGKVNAEQASAGIVWHGTAEAYTVGAADCGKLHSSNNVACTATLGADIPTGAEIEFMMKGSATLTIVCGNSSEKIYTGAGTFDSVSSAGQYATIVVKKCDADRFIAKGDLA